MDAGIEGSPLSLTGGKRIDWLDTGEQVLTPSSANQLRPTRKYQWNHSQVGGSEFIRDPAERLNVWKQIVKELTIDSGQ
jgi:hypothetical protein